MGQVAPFVWLKEVAPDDYRFLYSLLEEREREPNINIDHRALPSYEDHCAFCDKKPYRVWFIIIHGMTSIGAIYLTKHNEVGIHLTTSNRGKCIGELALKQLEDRFPNEKLIANINPKNQRSIAFFEKNGYRIKKVVYEKEV